MTAASRTALPPRPRRPGAAPLLAGALAALLAVAPPAPASASTSTSTSAAPAGAPTGASAAPERPGGERVGYFPSWGPGDGFHVRDIDRAAARLTVVDYAFGQVSDKGVCVESDGNPRKDAWRDYRRPVPASESVDGAADRPGQRLKGNFNQLRKLKERHPHLRVVISLKSAHFSDAALTAKSRAELVSSCVDLFIGGDLPETRDRGGPVGGPGSAAGVFDGIDLDWEYPAHPGSGGHRHRPADTRNFTLLMAEFRRRLDGAERRAGRELLLTAAVPPDWPKRSRIEAGELARHADFLNVMAYDFAGPWSPKGPTDHHANLRLGRTRNVTSGRLSAEQAARAYVAQGVPARKVVLGVPFYGYGWKDVPPHGHGLRQPAGAALDSRPYRFVARQPGRVFRDRAAGAVWKYDASSRTFWTFDDASTVRAKAAFVREHGLGGVMVWSLDGDDARGTLLSALDAGLRRGS
ncbi:glycoside hydrolase family 18 protein [Streptomyces radiopugnans]|uniref:glycoside hydrolase family 18 protein n=1 Tax=Streptomyces radiopugnans TaxID=403935 RepID=UPI003F1AD40D